MVPNNIKSFTFSHGDTHTNRVYRRYLLIDASKWKVSPKWSVINWRRKEKSNKKTMKTIQNYVIRSALRWFEWTLLWTLSLPLSLCLFLSVCLSTLLRFAFSYKFHCCYTICRTQNSECSLFMSVFTTFRQRENDKFSSEKKTKKAHKFTAGISFTCFVVFYFCSC